MGVQVVRHFGPLDKLQLVTVDDMKGIGDFVREQIVRQTLSGMDASGAPFAPYSEGYAKRKGSAFVNLQVSGAMLNDLTIVDVKADQTTATVTLGWTR